MEKWYVIGIDIGTQGTKTALFDSEGNKITEAFEASHLIYCRVGEVYQKPLEIYGSVLRTIRAVVEKSHVYPSKILALGIDAQMAGIMGVDENFEAVGIYDSWLDTRCEPYIKQMKIYAGEEIVRKTGGAVTYTHGPKILHRKKELPEEYTHISRFVLPGVYVAGKMCGLKAEQAWIDYTHLHFSGFADNEKKKWDEGLLEEFDVDKNKMPEIVNPWKIVGSLGREAAENCGLREGTQVVAGCGDSAASALGAGIVEKNMVYDVAGTASVFSCSTDLYTPDQEHQTIFFARSVLDELYTPLAYIGGGGLCLKWFCEYHGKDYAYWNREAKKIRTGSEDLYFVPHFSGRTCPNDPKVKGAYWGLSFCHTPAHMYRSIMESLAYEYMYYFSILKEKNHQIAPDCIYGAGGGTKSAVFNQIKADALGMIYQPLEEADTAVYASGMIAAYGVGLITQLKEHMRLSHKKESYAPIKDNHEDYKERMKRYIKLVDTLGTIL